MAERGHIQFADDAIKPIDSNGGGVYNLRQGTPSVKPPRLSKRGSLKTVDLENNPDEKNIVEERDVKQKQVFTGWYLFWLAYQSTGAIYGDIGTSPLYVYSSTFSSDPTYDDLLGALSLIIWTLTLIVSVKYVLIVLRADDEGEGGTFALYSLLSRYANIVRRDPREELAVKMERVLTSDLKPSVRKARSFIEGSRFAQLSLKILGVFGVSLVMSDGVLTPAQSVLGAIQGLEVVSPGITNATIVGTSCAILVLLFLIQPLGTSKLSSAFAPIVIIWLSFNFAFGIYNIAVHDHSVLKAFSPYFAGNYLVRNGTEGWKSLGGILLAFTGVEALFADLGAFSMHAVQLSWLGFAFPCLLLGYIGQAAYISHDPSAYSNPFFKTVPPGTFWPSLIIAILAAIVASQAMITATFQLLSQIMKLSYFPQIKLVHTSKIFHGQIYIPFANWLLMIGTVLVTAIYNNTTKLGHAYGVCVILVTFITTFMVALVALIIWRLPVVVVVLGFIVFGSLDGLYLSSALTKVPEGAWFTLALSVLLSCIFTLWRFGKEQQWRAEASDRFPLSHLLALNWQRTSTNGEPKFRMTPSFGGESIAPIKGMGIFFDKAGAPSTTPTVFIHFLQKFLAAPEVIVFFHLKSLPVPSVLPEERYTVTKCSVGGGADAENGQSSSNQDCFRLVIRHGYNDEVFTHDLGMLVFEQIRNFVIREGTEPVRSVRSVRETETGKAPTAPRILRAETDDSGTGPSGTSSSENGNEMTSRAERVERVSAHLALLQRAYDVQVVYVVGKEQMRIRALDPGARGLKGMTGVGLVAGFGRRVVLKLFLWIRENTRSKIQSLDVEVERLVEVGFVKVI